jgi:hypothetical protein
MRGAFEITVYPATPQTRLVEPILCFTIELLLCFIKVFRYDR